MSVSYYTSYEMSSALKEAGAPQDSYPSPDVHPAGAWSRS